MQQQHDVYVGELMSPAQKGLRDSLRRTFQRLMGAAGNILRPTTPAETARYEANKPANLRERELAEQQEKARAIVLRYRTEFDKRAGVLAKQLADKEITPGVFRAQMLIEIRYLLLTSAAAGAGGIGYLKPEDIARVDAGVKEQAQYLDRWISEIERAPELPSADSIERRARQYGGVGTVALNQTTDQNAFGEFPTLPFYPADRTNCYNNCKCYWQWSRVDSGAGNADVFWRLGVAEHCETCLLRARDFKPLRIRNWQIENLPGDLTIYLRTV